MKIFFLEITIYIFIYRNEGISFFDLIQIFLIILIFGYMRFEFGSSSGELIIKLLNCLSLSGSLLLLL